VTRQKGIVLQVLDRPSLGVHYPLYSLDDVIAMGQEELEKFDMCLKRHLAWTRSYWPLVWRKERMNASHWPQLEREAGLQKGSQTAVRITGRR
jgi:hypothetical protein